jgi:hypothetical protein
MTIKEQERMAELEAAVIDRERRMIGLISIIRRLVKDGATIPLDTTVDYTLTLDELKALGVTSYAEAIEVKLGQAG